MSSEPDLTETAARPLIIVSPAISITCSITGASPRNQEPARRAVLQPGGTARVGVWRTVTQVIERPVGDAARPQVDNRNRHTLRSASPLGDSVKAGKVRRSTRLLANLRPVSFVARSLEPRRRRSATEDTCGGKVAKRGKLRRTRQRRSEKARGNYSGYCNETHDFLGSGRLEMEHFRATMNPYLRGEQKLWPANTDQYILPRGNLPEVKRAAPKQ